MKNKKIRNFFLLSSPIFFLPIIYVNSCSSNSKSENQVKTDLDLALENKDISIALNSKISISQNFFDQFKNDKNEIVKMFSLENKTNLNVLFSIENISDYNSQDKSINCTFIIKDLVNETSKQVVQKFSFNMSTEEEYINSINENIVRSIKLKDEFKNHRLIDLFKQSRTNEEFIEKYIDQDFATKNSIGINYQLSIPTQTLIITNNNSNYLKFSLKLFNKKTNQEIKPSISNTTPFLNLEKNQKDTFTIFNAKDLIYTNTNDFNNFLNLDYLGQLLLRSENNEINELTINFDFSNKSIIGELDFSNFNKIIFNNTSFSLNKITKVSFNNNSSLYNLKPSLFTNNSIKEIHLPSLVEVFDRNAFDQSTTVYGLEHIDLFKRIIDSQNNLRLDQVIDINEMKLFLSFVTKVKRIDNQSKFNKVYLPTFNYDYDFSSYSILANELVFPQSNNKTLILNNFNIRNWSISNISIPSYIVSIKKDNLPISSHITREFNSEILNMISSKILTINNSTYFSFLPTSSLMKLINNLDDYFYSFNSSALDIEKIIFNDTSILNTSLSYNSWKFYTSISNVNKQIIFNSKVIQIDVDFFNSIKGIESKNLIRENYLANDTLDTTNKTLYLSKFYEKYLNNPNLNNYLVGLENWINLVDTSDVSIIKKDTFKNLKNWLNISINLNAGITTIEDSAFESSDIKIIQNDFNPKSIGLRSFYSSSITGDLNYSNLELISSSAFYGCKNINLVSFNKLSKLETSVFALSSITSIEIPLVLEIPDSTFYYCNSLTNINLLNITSIGNNAFYGCSKLTSLDLSGIKNIGSSAFSGTRISGPIIFNPDVILGSNVFNNVQTITLIKNFDLNKYTIDLNLFGSNPNLKPKIETTFSNEQIFSQIGFNQQNRILDLSIIRTWDNLCLNYLNIFSTYIRENQIVLEEVILPNEETIRFNLKYIFSGTTINKLTWRSPRKTINSHLSYYLANVNIKSLDKDFFVGFIRVPNRFLINLQNIDCAELNLENVKEIGSDAFYNLLNTRFTNTNFVNKIETNAFNKTSLFLIYPDCKLDESAFGPETNKLINNSNIRREKVFYNSIFNKIYDEQTKILDFSKITILSPANQSELFKYVNIFEYLLDGDVETLILPNVYILSLNLFSNLGNVNNIVFQAENQVISYDSFKGTNIANKPKLEETRIVIDLDNFLL